MGDSAAMVGVNASSRESSAAGISVPSRADESIADTAGKRVGILIVAYNAVTTLSRVLARITPRVWENVEEVVVFDDASQDATYEVAVGYRVLSEISKLRVIKNPRNLGYGGNQKAGYRYFLERGFDIVVLLHGDGQYAPEVLAHLYHPLVTGEADAVFGSRMMPDYGGPLKGGMPLYKYAGNRILSALENRALRMRLTEFHSGYRAYSLHALRRIDFSDMTDEFHFDTEIIIKLHHQGFRIREVPIPTFYGDEICYVNGLRYARDILRAVYRYKRTIRSAECYPEFKEYFIPPAQVSDWDRLWLEQFTGSGNEILALGAGASGLSRLAGQSNRVVALDADSAAAPGLERLKGERFDKILLVGALERMAQPEPCLQSCHALLKTGGQLLVAVPNVANLRVRLPLLFGRFEYAGSGILEKGHLRFFTRRSARRLLESCGYEVTREQVTHIPVERALGLPRGNWLVRFLRACLAVLTPLLPGLLGYECVLIARSRRSSFEIPQ